MVSKETLEYLKNNIVEYCESYICCNTAFVDTPKEWVTEKFKEHNEKTTNEFGFEADNYTRGDLQFSYDKDTNEVLEILMFPTFEDKDKGLYNGENFINVTDEYRDYASEVLSAAKEKFNGQDS